MNPDLDSTIETSNQTVILVIGVNGVGKTTTIGKLSSKLKSEGKECSHSVRQILLERRQ